MARNGKAPALGEESEGRNVVFAGDMEAHNTNATRVQFLTRLGIPLNRAVIVAAHCFGEARHAG